MIELTEDIKPQWTQVLEGWLKIVRRFQSTGRQQGGFAIVRIDVLINQDGFPVFWTSPKMTQIEPKQRSCEEIAMLLNNE
jgi:hypothetical protein